MCGADSSRAGSGAGAILTLAVLGIVRDAARHVIAIQYVELSTSSTSEVILLRVSIVDVLADALYPLFRCVKSDRPHRAGGQGVAVMPDQKMMASRMITGIGTPSIQSRIPFMGVSF